MISHYTKPGPKPEPEPEKMVRVYRADDPNRVVVLVPEFELVEPRAAGMPNYRLADELEG